MKSYLPISCQQYDILEILASRQQPTSVVYTNAEEVIVRKEGVRLKDLQTIRGEEFLWLDDESEPIRLDRLRMVGEEIFVGHCRE